MDIRVYGLVQGVGFRPFVHNLATGLALSGWALNRNDCVQIRIQGQQQRLETFIKHLQRKAPSLSKIELLVTEETSPESLSDFTILRSQNHSTSVTRVSPDVAVCRDCLSDMKWQANRIDYPFINCTNCGPRFSIIQDLPYDRGKTTMLSFQMCAHCRGEYENIRDRRYHAQPNACRDCGPAYELLYQNQTIREIEVLLEMASQLFAQGQILAIKGVGGFHLACDAANEPAVSELRRRKQREGKPFAVMFGSLETLKYYVEVNPVEETLLLSEQRPIVLLQTTSRRASKKSQPGALAPSVALGLDTLGVMLPYTPLHHLLFERLVTDAIVLTSGNVSDEPIVIRNENALSKLSPIADAILLYNRDIYNRSDDSVVFVAHNQPRLLRRSRGWAPEPVNIPLDAEGIVAAGAELKNCFCIGKGEQAILSQHIGDLKNLETFTFYQEAFTRFTRLFRVTPELIACDLHPDYLSTRFAREQQLPVAAIQHHHAHIAACMAEHGLDRQIIGISFDGTGFGDDQHIWGGEFLICDLSAYTRFSHFDYVPMPGGGKAAEEPWRMGVAYLHKTFGRDFLQYHLPFLESIPPKKLTILLTVIEKGINCPKTSSVGRLFDAIAAIINLVTCARFEAEAPIRLEAILEPTTERYQYEINDKVSVERLIRGIVSDLRTKIPNSIISAKFHNTLVIIIVELAEKMRLESGLNHVALSGGVFQNRYLLEHTELALETKGFAVYTHTQVPSNDGGIALGQLVVAAKRRQLGCV
ncbi:MAG: carbamoyltransferase HypF [bacterium]|nr:carbamoyltransferase HypF [bacterium]